MIERRCTNRMEMYRPYPQFHINGIHDHDEEEDEGSIFSSPSSLPDSPFEELMTIDFTTLINFQTQENGEFQRVLDQIKFESIATIKSIEMTDADNGPMHTIINPAQQSDYQEPNYQQSNYQQSDYQQSDYQQSDYQQSDYQESTYQQSDYQQSDYQQSDYQESNYQQSDYQHSQCAGNILCNNLFKRQYN